MSLIFLIIELPLMERRFLSYFVYKIWLNRYKGVPVKAAGCSFCAPSSSHDSMGFCLYFSPFQTFQRILVKRDAVLGAYDQKYTKVYSG